MGSTNYDVPSICSVVRIISVCTRPALPLRRAIPGPTVNLRGALPSPLNGDTEVAKLEHYLFAFRLIETS